jgi:uncharacterized membrane protein
MDFGKLVVLYIASFGVFFVIDLVWLGLMNSRFYKRELAGLMAEKVKWLPAVIFYLLFVFTGIVLIVRPAVEKGAWTDALWRGGLLGMIAYGTYDFTNLATIKNWPLKVTIIDIVWGTCLSAAISTAGYFIATGLGL